MKLSLPYWMMPYNVPLVKHYWYHFRTPAENNCYATILLMTALLPMLIEAWFVVGAFILYALTHYSVGIWQMHVLARETKIAEENRIERELNAIKKQNQRAEL